MCEARLHICWEEQVAGTLSFPALFERVGTQGWIPPLAFPRKERGWGFSEKVGEPGLSPVPTSSLKLCAVNCTMGRPKEGTDKLLFSVSSEEKHSQMWPVIYPPCYNAHLKHSVVVYVLKHMPEQ